ncbi:hypothetical protein M2282_003029 [Variovorax boronicumulans]|uniref:DUF7822 domain-containing protein n=1 Tax=Variovorax boronicumulans TaxID=436515 RepID=UPI002474416B|nr:hypothetical protein [Variovorax boronicumulans]MDH6167879.1 hypothetical protein [Variovorax boronicumulans]
MANRSYLFASPFVPGPNAAGNDPKQLKGLSECNYNIPLVYQLLVSTDVQLCRSTIWTSLDEPTALAGRAGAGIDRLHQFLSRIDHPSVAPLRDQALDFLNSHADRNGYFVLECAEIFDMGDEPLGEQAVSLLRDVQNIDTEIEAAISRLAPQKKTFWDRIFTPSQESIEAPLRELGLGYWSDTLYYSPNDAS